MRSFADGSRELERQVGHGTLSAAAFFPGPSSGALERGYWVSGPNAGVRIRNYHGGDKHFLSRALEGGGLRDMAKACLDGRGADEAFDQARRTAERAAALAPIRTGLLRLSPGHAAVDDGVVVRDRPALPSSVAPNVPHPRHHSRVHPTQ
jgi:hypothetical protein